MQSPPEYARHRARFTERQLQNESRGREYWQDSILGLHGAVGTGECVRIPLERTHVPLQEASMPVRRRAQEHLIVVRTSHDYAAWPSRSYTGAQQEYQVSFVGSRRAPSRRAQGQPREISHARLNLRCILAIILRTPWDLRDKLPHSAASTILFISLPLLGHLGFFICVASCENSIEQSRKPMGRVRASWKLYQKPPCRLSCKRIVVTFSRA